MIFYPKISSNFIVGIPYLPHQPSTTITPTITPTITSTTTSPTTTATPTTATSSSGGMDSVIVNLLETSNPPLWTIPISSTEDSGKIQTAAARLRSAEQQGTLKKHGRKGWLPTVR